MPRSGFQLRSDMSRNVGEVGHGFSKQCLLVRVHTRLKALQFAISVGLCLQQNAPPETLRSLHLYSLNRSYVNITLV